MSVTLHLGDCLDVLKGMEANSFDGVLCDPPYGLSENRAHSIDDRIVGVLPDIVLPNLNEVDPALAQDIKLGGVPVCRATLRGGHLAGVIKAGIGVPESTVDLDCRVVLRQKEVNGGDIAPTGGVTDAELVNGIDAEGGEFLGDYILYLGDTREFARRNSGGGIFAELLSGGFAMPIVPLYVPGTPCPLSGLAAVILGDYGIGLGYDALGQSLAPSGVVAGAGAVNTFMLRFDLRRGTIELAATYRASHNVPGFAVGRPQLVRTGAAASSLPPPFKPVRVGLVGFAADGAHSFYLHLWLPEKWVSILNPIIPHGGFMAKQWDAATPDPEVWRELYRVCKPGAMMLAFGGTRTFHRLTCAIEDAGWEIRDCVVYLYGSGFPKSANISKMIDRAAGAEREVIGLHPHAAASLGNGINMSGGKAQDMVNITAPATPLAATWDGYGTSLKPAWEPCIVAMKPTDGTFAQNAAKWNVAGLAIDACRIPTNPNVDDPRLGGNGTWNPTGKSMFFDGRGKEVGSSPSGRWPANLLLDAEAAAALDQMSGERGGGFATRGASTRIYGGGKGFTAATGAAVGYGDSGGASRFFYTAKASRREREAGLEGLPERDKANQYGDGLNSATKVRTAEQAEDGVDRGTARNHHPTVKPLSLCEYLARLILPPAAYRDTARLLVPFAGSGSEMIGALQAGWRNVEGIEKEAEYVEIARRRLDWWQRQLRGNPRPLPDWIEADELEPQP